LREVRLTLQQLWPLAVFFPEPHGHVPVFSEPSSIMGVRWWLTTGKQGTVQIQKTGYPIHKAIFFFLPLSIDFLKFLLYLFNSNEGT